MTMMTFRWFQLIFDSTDGNNGDGDDDGDGDGDGDGDDI
jgi:hypothetical protein